LGSGETEDGSMEKQERGDIYSRITADIIAAIEAGVAEFTMPWHHDGASTSRPINVVSNKPYRGINTLALWVAATRHGYASGVWGTYQQWNARDAQVRRGESGTTVVFWKINDRAGQNQDDDNVDHEAGHHRILARAYTVFNSAQVDGYTPPELPILANSERIDAADRFCSNLGIDVRHGGDRAFYTPTGDFVQMPEFQNFHDGVSYYAVLLHESGHASGAKHRLDRDLSGRFGSEPYAMEECVVEILSALICADLSLSIVPRPDHACYIASWLKVLRNDTRAIFTASSKAQQAADWMHAQQSAADIKQRSAAA
jgi:antirestriction protein ArdC